MTHAGAARIAIGLLIAVVLGGCGTKRIPECDELLATLEKVATCGELAAEVRTRIDASAAQIRTSLEALDRAGGVADAPADVVGRLRDTCKASSRAMVADSKLTICLE